MTDGSCSDLADRSPNGFDTSTNRTKRTGFSDARRKTSDNNSNDNQPFHFAVPFVTRGSSFVPPPACRMEPRGAIGLRTRAGVETSKITSVESCEHGSNNEVEIQLCSRPIRNERQPRLTRVAVIDLGTPSHATFFSSVSPLPVSGRCDIPQRCASIPKLPPTKNASGRST